MSLFRERQPFSFREWLKSVLALCGIFYGGTALLATVALACGSDMFERIDDVGFIIPLWWAAFLVTASMLWDSRK